MNTIDTKALRERFITAVEEFGKCYCVDYFSDWSVEYDWLDPEYPTAEIRLELMFNEFRTVPLCLSDRDELAIDIGDAGILYADGYGLMSFLWNEAEQALSAANDRLDKIERLSETGTAQAFAALSDDDKLRWFAITGQRDKWARERLAALEAELSEAQSKCADMHTENANLASEAGNWRRVAEKLEAENKRLRKALNSIHIYGLDTLSGRTDGPDDRAWQRQAVSEITRRAEDALAAGAEQPASAGDWRCPDCGYIDAQRVTIEGACDACRQPVEWDESRIDVIGQNGNGGHHYADAERESLPLMARRPRMYPGQSACEIDGVLYSVADTDEHGLPVVERTPDMPAGAKYRQRIRANGEVVACHYPYLPLAEDRWGALERIEDYNERGQEGRE